MLHQPPRSTNSTKLNTIHLSDQLSLPVQWP
jgi:hypothetical protein